MSTRWWFNGESGSRQRSIKNKRWLTQKAKEIGVESGTEGHNKRIPVPEFAAEETIFSFSKGTFNIFCQREVIALNRATLSANRYMTAVVGGVRFDVCVDGGISEESDRKEKAIILFNGDYR